jgi:hypothetical protein
LANGSRILALPNNENTVRCYSGVSLLIIDEASRVPDGLIAAVLPMVMASQGRQILLSTPCGQKGFFYEQWINHRIPWERIAARASECPRFDPALLSEQRQMMGDNYYRQEFECEFLQAADQVFSLDSIENAFRSTAQALYGF